MPYKTPHPWRCRCIRCPQMWTKTDTWHIGAPNMPWLRVPIDYQNPRIRGTFAKKSSPFSLFVILTYLAVHDANQATFLKHCIWSKDNSKAAPPNLQFDGWSIFLVRIIGGHPQNTMKNNGLCIYLKLWDVLLLNICEEMCYLLLTAPLFVLKGRTVRDYMVQQPGIRSDFIHRLEMPPKSNDHTVHCLKYKCKKSKWMGLTQCYRQTQHVHPHMAVRYVT